MAQPQYRAERWAVMKGDVIVKMYTTSQGKAGVMKSLENQRIIDYDRVILVDRNHEGKPKRNINEYTNKGVERPLAMRVKDGYATLPPDMKLDGDIIRPKTLKEKIADGVYVVPTAMMFDEAKDEVRPMTEEEQVAEGLITQKQLDEIRKERLIAEEMQKILREQAEARLKAEGKI